jgi:hypothetical protein
MKRIFLLFILLLPGWAAFTQGVGIGTSVPKAPFHVASGKTVLFGSDTSGGGSKLMWIPSKYAFRAGGIGAASAQGFTFNEDPHAWDADSIGAFSFAGGYGNKAIGMGSTAFGLKNSVQNYASFAAGEHNELNNEYTWAVGSNNTIISNSSMAFGLNNMVNSAAGFAIGSNNEVYGDFNIVAIGSSNTCTAFNAMALGHYNDATNLYSTAIGADHMVGSVYGMSIGFNTINNSRNCIIVGASNASLSGWSPDAWKATDPIFIVGNGYQGNRNNAMLIQKNGWVGINTNTPDGLLHLRFNSSIGLPQLLLEESSNDYSRITFRNTNPGYWDVAAFTQPFLGNTSSAHMNFYFSQFGNVLSLRGNGNASLAGVLTQNSDERLKKNIEPLSNALSRMLKINGYTYNWKDTLRGSDLQIGFLAQEVEAQFPELVATDEEGIKSVAYGNMVPVLLQAIKEQQQQIDDLQTKVNRMMERQ